MTSRVRSSDIFSMDNPDVLVLIMASGLINGSTFRSSSFFMARFSITPSIIQSASDNHERWSSKLPGVMSLASSATNMAGGLAPIVP